MSELSPDVALDRDRGPRDRRPRLDRPGARRRHTGRRRTVRERPPRPVHDRRRPDPARRALRPRRWRRPRARFEELRPDRAALAENAAVRTERHRARSQARDPDGAALFRASQWSSTTGGPRCARSPTARAVPAPRCGSSPTELADGSRSRSSRPQVTASCSNACTGDRRAPDREVDVESSRVNEVDADGLITASCTSTPTTAPPRSWRWSGASSPAKPRRACESQAPIDGVRRRLRERDWAALATPSPTTSSSRDHRYRLDGRSDRDEYVSSMRVFAELSPDVTSENVEILAWGWIHGRVARRVSWDPAGRRRGRSRTTSSGCW